MRGTKGVGKNRKEKRPTGSSGLSLMSAQRGRGTGSCSGAGTAARSGPVAMGSACARATAA
eukprot:522574-Prorocentrum_lima.AAC.1